MLFLCPTFAFEIKNYQLSTFNYQLKEMDISFYLKKRKCSITVPHGVQRLLAERFGVSKQLVSYALKQERDSKLAREIRRVAMDELGGAFEKVKDHADGAEPSINYKR